MIHQIIVWSASAILILICWIILFWFAALSIDVIYVGHNKQTSLKVIWKISKILRQYHKEDAVFYDLGACRGNFLLWLTIVLPHLKARGVDISHFRALYANLKAKIFFRQAKFLQGDFFKQDLSGAGAVYMFLDQEDVSKAETKLAKELPAGCLVITNTAYFNNWTEKGSYITNPKNPKEEKIFAYIKE